MMGMNDMMGRCMDAMSSMMGGGMMGSGIVPVGAGGGRPGRD
jgi:hypothetical protein